MGKSISVIPQLAVGEEAEVVVTYSTKGMDVFKYNLSAYQNNVIENLQAHLKLNTADFEILPLWLTAPD